MQVMNVKIWRWFSGEYKAHCQNRDQYEKVLGWKKSRAGGVYILPDGTREWDVIIPEEYIDRAAAVLTSVSGNVDSSQTEK